MCVDQASFVNVSTLEDFTNFTDQKNILHLHPDGNVQYNDSWSLNQIQYRGPCRGPDILINNPRTAEMFEYIV